MTQASLYDRVRARIVAGLRDRAMIFKAVSFAVIGVINSAVDYGAFLIGRALLDHSPTAWAVFGSISASCQCGSPAAISLIAANALSWIVAATGSYVMNSTVTFAAESGRKLRWRSFFAFLASGFAGWIVNTITLLIAAEVLLMPVWLAKLVAILASFMVNFLLSHFFVFRVRPGAKVDAAVDAEASGPHS
jgi:putative flippase GtrA